MTIGLSIIGAGEIGAKHAAAVRSAGLRVTGVFDNDALRAKTLAAKYDALTFGEYRQALHHRDTDAIVIAVPNVFHKSMTVAALEADKDVLLEKPMALNREECDEILRVCSQTGRLVQIGFVHRYTGVGKLAKQIISDGALGNVYHVTAQVRFRRGVPGLGKWFTTKELSGGGALIDVGVHLLDLVLHLLDFPQVAEVCGQTYSNFGRRMQDYIYESMWAAPPNLQGICDVEDSAHAFIRFQNGMTLDLDSCWAGNFPEVSVPPTCMGLFGDRGGLTFQLFGDSVHFTSEKNGKLLDERSPVPETDPFHEQILDFARSINSRQAYGPSGQQGQIVQSIVDRVYQSSERASAKN